MGGMMQLGMLQQGLKGVWEGRHFAGVSRRSFFKQLLQPVPSEKSGAFLRNPGRRGPAEGSCGWAEDRSAETATGRGQRGSGLRLAPLEVQRSRRASEHRFPLATSFSGYSEAHIKLYNPKLVELF